MKIIINQQLFDTEKQILLEILEENQLASKSGIAVALNQQVIPRNAWNETQVNENDSITIITATQGG